MFRVTIAASEAKGRVFTTQRLINDYDSRAATFAFRAPIEATSAQLALAVTVDELTTGMWGGQKAR